MSDDSNTKYYVGGAIVLLLLLWSKKSSAKKITEAPSLFSHLRKNILKELPNVNSFSAGFSAGSQHYVREVFNPWSGLLKIDSPQQGPLLDASVSLPDPNVNYGLLLAVTRAPESGFLEKIEDLGNNIGISPGWVDAGVATGGKVAKFGVSLHFLGMTTPGQYVVALTVKPEKRKLSDGRLEQINYTQEEMKQLPRSYVLVTIPPLMA